jgi:hypothetical protein
MIATILLQAGGGLGLPAINYVRINCSGILLFHDPPANEKTKRQKKYVDELKKGDKVSYNRGYTWQDI